MGERSGAPSGLTPPSIVISKPPVAVHLPQPDVSANRDAPHGGVALIGSVLEHNVGGPGQLNEQLPAVTAASGRAMVQPTSNETAAVSIGTAPLQ